MLVWVIDVGARLYARRALVAIGFRSALAWTFACMFAWSSTHAHAQPSPEPALPPEYDEPRPWAAGVSESEQAIARELYVAGNHEYTESRCAQALVKWKEAIQHWDNPAIRYNMVECLIDLDQPVEARDNLERSLAYGPAPLGADMYARGLTYRKLLDAQLAHVKIACREPGAMVTLDGKLLFTGPGMADQFLVPGEHQVVATKVGFLTASKTLVLVAGKLTTDDIRPTLEVKPTTRMVRRWERWKPWGVLAGGGRDDRARRGWLCHCQEQLRCLRRWHREPMSGRLRCCDGRHVLGPSSHEESRRDRTGSRVLRVFSGWSGRHRRGARPRRESTACAARLTPSAAGRYPDPRWRHHLDELGILTMMSCMHRDKLFVMHLLDVHSRVLQATLRDRASGDGYAPGLQWKIPTRRHLRTADDLAPTCAFARCRHEATT